MSIQNKSDLEKAEQQFVGYAHAKGGYGAVSLAKGMALTAEEWVVLRDDVSGYLADDDLAELDAHFKHVAA